MSGRVRFPLLRRGGAMAALFLGLAIPAYPVYVATAADPVDKSRHGTISMAVVADAWPFIWKDANSGEYTGYLWDICKNATQRAGYAIAGNPQEVTPHARQQFIDDGTGAFDLLCAPTVITIKRMENFLKETKPPGRRFSPMLFPGKGIVVTNPPGNIRYRVEDSDAPLDASLHTCNNRIIACVDNTEADCALAKTPGPTIQDKENIKISLTKKSTKNAKDAETYQLWGYVEDFDFPKTLESHVEKRQSRGEKICLIPFDTHTRAATAFCDGKLTRYFGNSARITAALADRRNAEKVPCAPQESAISSGVYEPYGLVLAHTTRDSAFPDRFMHALYRMFRDGEIRRIHDIYFSGQHRFSAQHLDAMFHIHRFPLGEVREQQGGGGR